MVRRIFGLCCEDTQVKR